jgi:hypothetical protein
MLTIRPQQFRRLEEYMFEQFLLECAQIVRERRPGLAARLGDEKALREFVGASVKRWQGQGFTEREHLIRLLDWECEYGVGYLEKPRWEWARQIFSLRLDPASRIFRVEKRMGILRERGEL